MFSKESEEERRREFLAPDYSEASKRKEDEEDPDEIGITDDDDDDFDDLDDIEDDDPEDEEKILEIRESLPEVEDDLPFKDVSSPQPPKPQPSPRSFFQPQQQYQPRMATQNWPTGNSGSFWNQGGNNQQGTPWGSQGNSNPWQKPASTWGGGSTGNNGIWGQGNNTNQAEVLNRQKKVIICDVLDCLICTQDGPQRLGVIPRDIWDIMPRFDVWMALRRFGYIERLYALIPKSLMSNNDEYEDWVATLNWLSRALARFLRIDKSSVQIITPAFIAQPKIEVIDNVLGHLPKDEIVYIGTQSGYQGQSSIDVDCANSLNIDYIDLGRFLTIYS